jgi:hypothetical protein
MPDGGEGSNALSSSLFGEKESNTMSLSLSEEEGAGEGATGLRA